jgi:NAD(P)-dependent dehydrogenase (short-subunit alcohol dehydrogenase family)
VSEVVADDFAGLVAVVTGGASGMGAAAAELFRDAARRSRCST